MNTKDTFDMRKRKWTTETVEIVSGTDNPIAKPLTEIEKAELLDICKGHSSATTAIMLRRLLYELDTLKGEEQ